MADAAPPPPPKKRGPLRWILLGCGALTGLLILGLGSCAGIFYAVYRGSEPVARAGSDYLAAAPEMRKAFGDTYGIRRQKLGFNVHVVNDGGNARFAYDVLNEHGAEVGEAVVWLLRAGGKWSVVGARVHPKSGEPLSIGEPPKEHHRIDWD